MARKLLIAGTCATLLALSLVAAGVNAGSASRLTAELTQSHIRLGELTTVAGRLTGAPAEDANQVLTVFAKPWPYKREEIVGNVITDSTGRYSLRVRPRRNTRYVVRTRDLPTIESVKQPIVWVYPKRSRTVAKFVRPRLGSARMILEVDPDHPYRFQGRTLYFYFRKRASKVFRRVARTRTRLARPGKVTGHARFKIPRGDYRFIVSWCFDPGRKDFGVGRPVREDCPRRRFRAGTLGKL